MPPVLNYLILQLLRKDVAGRPSTAAQVAAELEKIIARPDRGLPWNRRRVLAAFALPTIAATAYFAWSRSRREKEIMPPDSPAPEAVPNPFVYDQSRYHRELRLGSTQQARIDHFSFDPASPFTIEGWVTLESPAFDETDSSHIMGTESATIFANRNTWSYRCNTTTGGEGRNFHDFARDPKQHDRRVHLAYVRTASQVRLFVDGVLKAQRNIPDDTLFNRSRTFTISGNTLSLRFDEIRISTIARYGDDFAPEPIHFPDEHTFALYHCDDEGPMLIDSSGNNHHGRHNGTFVLTPRTDLMKKVLIRGLHLPPRATGFCGNFHLDPLRTFTAECFITFQTDRFHKSEAQQFMATNCFSLFGCDDKWLFGYKMLTQAGEKKSTHFAGIAPIRPGHRHHLAGVHLGPQLRLYLDGKLIASENIGHDWRWIESNWLSLGGCIHPLTIDEARISTIASYHKDFVPEPRHKTDAHTFVLYHLDEEEGTVMTDSSGHQRHGVNHGGEWKRVNPSQ